MRKKLLPELGNAMNIVILEKLHKSIPKFEIIQYYKSKFQHSSNYPKLFSTLRLGYYCSAVDEKESNVCSEEKLSKRSSNTEQTLVFLVPFGISNQPSKTKASCIL